ncbi:MAG: response regulator [Bacteroidota bacterium]
MKEEIKIFLAEDDRDDSFLFQEALNKIGYRTVLSVAQDGELLTEMLEKNAVPDFIFLDLNMPKKDGYSCLREIRSSAKLDRVPVIIMSTSSNEQSIERAYNEGADLYVRKPDNFADLQKIIETCISKRNEYPDKPSKEKFFLTI